MVDDVKMIRGVDRRAIDVSGDDLELLFSDLLGELLYLKDAEHALYRIVDATIETQPTVGPLAAESGTEAVGAQPSLEELYRLHATIAGEMIDPACHNLGVDVKAVTLDQLRVWAEDGEYRARVILDT